MAKPDWTRYSEMEFIQRAALIAEGLEHSAVFLVRSMTKAEFGAEMLHWAYALENIPTHHIEECFGRAIREHDTDFPFLASAVIRAYKELIPELQARAQANSGMQEYLLREGYASLGCMNYDEWKERHNLPAHWRSTGYDIGFEGYPPESDLYRGPFPATKQERMEYFERGPRKVEPVYACEKCHDAGWTSVPFDARVGSGPTLIECECKNYG